MARILHGSGHLGLAKQCRRICAAGAAGELFGLAAPGRMVAQVFVGAVTGRSLRRWPPWMPSEPGVVTSAAALLAVQNGAHVVRVRRRARDRQGAQGHGRP